MQLLEFEICSFGAVYLDPLAPVLAMPGIAAAQAAPGRSVVYF